MFTMTVAIVGAGVLALPFAVHKVRTPQQCFTPRTSAVFIGD